jgi:threonine/homoserine/homoserine lactone efflux protein
VRARHPWVADGGRLGAALGQMLPAAVGVAGSPMPIVAVVLMLVTPRARVNGPAFLAGWMLGILILGAILLAVLGPADTSDEGGPTTWVSVLELVLGVLLVLVAVRQWRGRPHAGEDVATPKWMGALDGFTPVKAAGAGALLGSINPKNLLLIVAGVTAIAQTEIPAGEQAVSWVVFMLIASIGVGAPVVIFFALGDRAPALLNRLKDWMAHNNAVIMAVLCLIIGVKLIGDAITGLST